MRQIILCSLLILCVACNPVSPIEETQEEGVVVNVPTVASVTITPTLEVTNTPQPTSTPLSIPQLDTMDAVIDLLVQARQDGATRDQLNVALIEQGWIVEPEFPNTLNIDPWTDVADDWIIILGSQRDRSLTEGDVSSPAWDAVIIDEAGLRYRYTDDVVVGEFEQFSQPVQFVTAVDFVGEDQSELIFKHSTCGAHTCFDTYHVVQRQLDGRYERISPSASPDIENVNSLISNSYTNTPIMTTFEGKRALAVNGGSVGSIGGGLYQRRWTTYWTLNPDTNQIEKAGLVRDESNIRFHALHDANDLFAAGDYVEAEQLYVQIINDTTLYEDPPEFDLAKEESQLESTYDSTRQFAAFRLILVNILLGDGAGQDQWVNWLPETYPGSMAADAIPTLLNYADDLPANCPAVTAWFEAEEESRVEDAAGTITDLGYQLPWLTAETFCPVE